MIRQKELADYRAIVEQVRLLTRRRNAMRADLLRRVQAEESVAVGILAVRVVTCSYRRISYGLVRRVLGDSWVAWLTSWLPPTQSTSLEIIEESTDIPAIG